MRVVSVIDSFKGCATSAELNAAALADLPAEIWQEKINVPIADGGEGTLAAIYAALGGEWVTVASQDPLLRELAGQYLLSHFAGKRIAVIESAAFIGLHLVEPDDQVVRQATSYGLGAVLQDALTRNVEQIYVTLGGSATSDGGLGLLQALAQLPATANPLLAEQLFFPPLNKLGAAVELFALADVTNPYSGEQGFAKVFAPQKGASKKTVVEMEHRAQKAVRHFWRTQQMDLAKTAGAGAAGGLGGAVILLGGKMIPGFPMIQKMIGLETILREADLVFTGEGKMDAQTAAGKVPYGVAQLAATHQVPVIGLCGSREAELGELEHLLLGAFSIQQAPISLQAAMEKERTLKNIRILAADLSRIFAKK